MKVAWRRIFLIASVGLSLVTSVVWATGTELNLSLNIQPAGAAGDNSSAAHGQFAYVTPLSGQLTAPRGAADDVSGGAIYQIDYGDSSLSQMSRIHLILQDPLDMDKIFHDNKMVIHVYVYYPAPSGSSGYETITVGSTTINVFRDTGATFAPGPLINPANADMLIRPSVVAKTLYITTSVNVYHDNGKESTPSGQDGKISGLKFYCDVHP